MFCTHTNVFLSANMYNYKHDITGALSITVREQNVGDRSVFWVIVYYAMISKINVILLIKRK